MQYVDGVPKGIVKDYIIGEELGQGSYGKVMMGVHKESHRKVALKFINTQKLKSSDKERVSREVQLTSNLDHPNIIKLLDYEEIGDFTIFILEFVSGGELFDYILSRERLEEREAIRFFRQIFQGVEYCHSNLVIHRDLKLENILLDFKGSIKISDFGLSNTMAKNGLMDSFCGSPLYSAPEIVMETKYIGPEVDVWSLGVILYAMVSGFMPWDGDNVKDQLLNIVMCKYRMPDNVSVECWDLIKRCLTLDPKLRATMAEIRVHPWLSIGYNAPPPSCMSLKRDSNAIDLDIIEQMVNLKFSEEEVTNDIRASHITSRGYVIYHLLLDKKNKERGSPMRLAMGCSESSGEKSSSSFSSFSSFQSSSGYVKRLSTSVPNTPSYSDNENNNGLSSPSLSDSCPSSPVPSRAPSFSRSSNSTSSFRGLSSLFNKEGPLPKVASEKPAIDQVLYKGVRKSDPSPLSDNHLRLSKGPFTSETLTSMKSMEIQADLDRALTSLRLPFTISSKGTTFTVKVPDTKVGVKLEICRTERLEKPRGVKIKRISGDSWSYKNLRLKIISELRLKDVQ